MSDPNDVRTDRLYTSDHEWAKDEGSSVAIGITAYAVDKLGDVTLVDLRVAEGDAVEAGKAFGTIESVKTLSDLYAPLSGKVVRVNAALVDAPETVNEDCYGEGWMIVVEPADASQEAKLLSPDAYAKLIAEG